MTTSHPPGIDGSSGGEWSLSQPNARRSLILCAIGAVAGLLIAGFGLFTAQGTRTAHVPAEDAAVVNQVPILMTDFEQQLRALYDTDLAGASPRQRKKVLDDMIREELYVQRGVELGLQADTVEVRDALVGAVEAQTAADATMAQPGEAELRDYHAKHPDEFADEGILALVDYRLPPGATDATIAAAVAVLDAAGPGDPAARALPRSGAMADGDEYYFAAKLHLGDRLFAVARHLRPGERSAPVRLPDGVHILVVSRNVPPAVPPFAAIRDKVLAAYVAAQAKTLTAANGRFLRKRADIQIAPGFE